MVDVEYSWIPTKCRRCGHLGHKEPRCLQQTPLRNLPQAGVKVSIFDPSASVPNTKDVSPGSAPVPIVDVAHVPIVAAAPTSTLGSALSTFDASVSEHATILTTSTAKTIVKIDSVKGYATSKQPSGLTFPSTSHASVTT